VAAAAFAVVVAFLVGGLGFELLRGGGDALDYWIDSLHWREPFHPFHVPGYPLVLAALHLLTFGKVAPAVLMGAVNLAALLLGVELVRRILRESGASTAAASAGAILYALWPFVGIVYAACLQAEVPAMALFLAGLYALQRSRRGHAALFLGLALVTHKALWPFTLLAVLAEFSGEPRKSMGHATGFFALLLGPLALLWGAGVALGRPLGWLVATNLRREVASRGGLPILDGLSGTLLRGDLRGLSKGSVVAGVAVLAGWLLVRAMRRPYGSWRTGAALAASVLFLAVALNQWEIWATVRFSRLLVLPLVWTAAAAGDRLDRVPAALWAGGWGLLFASQLAWAWYMARVYFG
jgi:hypothetical protein